MVGIKTHSGTTRDGFGTALAELGATNAQIVVLSGDLSESMRVTEFMERFPERFLDMGVQEENMVGIAAGLALSGKIPFACSYAVFVVNNALGPLRASVCYSNANAKIIGGHAGLTTGPDGATHQALEDIALMRTLPNMTVVVPADQEEARKATHAIGKHIGPCYLRIGKYSTPTVTTSEDSFTLGKANILKKGSDITVVACGPMVALAKQAAEIVEQGKNGESDISVEVINMHTIKPLDIDTVLTSLKKTNALLTVEDHQIAGGMGSSICEAVIQSHPEYLTVPVKIMGMEDSFGESGTPSELLEKYHLDAASIANQIQKIVRLKQK